MNYVHNIIIMVKMGPVVMKNDDYGYNEHQDDGGWDMMDEEDGGYIMSMIKIRMVMKRQYDNEDNDGDNEDEDEPCL